MVSTEENSSDFDSAWRALSVVMSPEALNAARAASWLTPKAEPKAYGAEEPAALAFLYDDDSALAPKNPVAKLVVDHDTPVHKDGTGKHVEKRAVEALITTKDIEKIAAEVTQRCMAAGVAPAEIAKLLAKLASNVGASKSSLEEIRGEALKAADDLVSEAVGKGGETPVQKAERLWQEAKKAEEKAQAESHKLDAWKKPDDLEKENAAEKKYQEALEEYERLKASGASQAELEAAQKRMILAQHVLTEARKESMQGVINNPKAPSEIREQAQQVIASSADAEKRFHEAEVGLERDKSNTTAIIQQTAAVETNADTKAAKMAEISTDLASNRSTQFGSLDTKMASIESEEPTSSKPTTLAHAEVGVLEATSAAPNVQGSGKGANIGVVKT